MSSKSDRPDGLIETDLAKMSSEEIEILAIGDTTSGQTLSSATDHPETEQDIEYGEKRELAKDERENADPTRH